MSGSDAKLREELNALLDGALPEERAAELRRRMETDAALRKEYEELVAIARLVRSLCPERAPAALRRNVRAALRPASRILRPRWTWVAAAAALLAAGLLIVPRLRPEPARPRGRQTAAKPAAPGRDAARRGPADRRASGEVLEKLERAEAGVAARTNLVERIEKGGSLSPEEQGAYLAALSRLSPDKLAGHIATVGRRSLGHGSSDASLLAELTVPDAVEAAKLRTVLLRGYEALEAEDRAKARLAFASKAPGALAREKKAPEALVLDLELTPSQASEVAGWLRLFDTGAARARPRVQLRGGKLEEKARKKSAAKRRVRIVIRVAPPAGR